MKIYETRNEMIADLIKPDHRVCELGVFQGDFAKEIMKLSPRELVLVDPWKGLLPSGDCDGNNVKVANLDAAYWNLCREYEHNKKVKLMRGLSWDILEGYADCYFDFIYIDSSHSYEGTKRELILALRKIRETGFIALHDYEINKAKCKHDYNFGVKQAVDEFCKEFFIEPYAKAMDGCVSIVLKIGQ